MSLKNDIQKIIDELLNESCTRVNCPAGGCSGCEWHTGRILQVVEKHIEKLLEEGRHI